MPIRLREHRESIRGQRGGAAPVGVALTAGLLALAGCVAESGEPFDGGALAEAPAAPPPSDAAQEAAPSRSLPELSLTRDYRYPPQDRAPSPHALLRDLPDGTTVTYYDFDGNPHSLRQFNGKHTALLLSQSLLDEVGLPRVRQVIDDADLLYATKAEITGAEPPGAGLLRIAVVPATCGIGCGYINYKGIEIVPDVLKGKNLIYVINHELDHNFDSLSPFLFTPADSAHSWTEVLSDLTNVHLRRGGSPREEGLALSNEEYLAFRSRLRLDTYEQYPGANWQDCIADEICDPPGDWTPTRLSMHTQSGIALRVFELFGTRQEVRDWVQGARALVQSRGYVWNGLTSAERREFLIETLSLGVGANLSCFFDAWNWPVSSSLRANLTSLFGASNPLCDDADGDGFSRQQGDCNDASAAIKPNAVETSNGVDDNCNGIVDEQLVVESGDFPNSQGAAQAVGFPARILGSAGVSGDYDHFSIYLPATTTVRFTLRSLDTYLAWMDVYHQGSSSSKDAFFIWPGDRNISKLTLGPGQWNFSVWGGAVGTYELLVQPDPEFPVTPQDYWPITFTPGPVSNPSANQFVFPAPTIPPELSGVSGLQVRHWVSGYGWVGTTPATTSFTWFAPSGTDPQELVHRSQFVTATIPEWPLSQHRNLVTLSWTSQDVGSVGTSGSTAQWVDNFAVEGSGAGITGSADAFHLSWVKVSGDATIVARVVSLENTSGSALAGVTIRESLDANAKHATVAVTPSSTILFQQRTSTGGWTTSSTATQSETAPRWLKLQRSGNSFEAYRSTDGVSWSQIGSTTTISMGTTVYVGIAATSANHWATATAQIDDVAVTGTIVP